MVLESTETKDDTMKPDAKLLTLPLFQGLSQQDLWHIMETTPMTFLSHNTLQPIANENERCDRLIFLLDGTVNITTFAHDHSYRLTEELQSPRAIEPEHLFGLHQRFMSKYTAQGKCNTMSISKSDIVRLTERYDIFRINLQNILSTQIQRLQQRPWHPSPTNLQERIVRFFFDHCTHPAGKKDFVIKMSQLATELNDTRLNVSAALNALENKQLITLTRGHITIPALERLK